MKLTTILLLIGTIQIFSKGLYSQETDLTLHLGVASVGQVLTEIENQSEFYFLFNQKLVDTERKVNIQVEDVKINFILDQLFSETNIEYVVMDKQIVLSPKEFLADIKAALEQQSELQQNTTVSGVVTGEDGETLQGVTVSVKGTVMGTISDGEGRFILENVPPNAILVFSFVGMLTQEIAVGTQVTINVILKLDVMGLEEVVVTGYGTQRKVNLTGAISTVSFDDEIQNRPITNASQALGGKITGVWVSQNSGKPGIDGAQIRVRGWGTLNDANPLIIIDGVEGSFDQINPSDIQNLSVLKDAASAAIYGSKAANGVILITTKMGRQNQKMSVNLTSYVGIQSLGRRYDMITNSAEHMTLANQANINNGGSEIFPDYMITNFANGNDPYVYPNTDWFEVMFENAIIHEHNLSVSGGTNNTKSFFSLNYLNHDGMIMNTNSERYGIRANVESNVTDWFKIDGRINYSRRISKEPYDAGQGHGTTLPRVFNMLEGAAPFIAPYTADGRYGSVQAIANDGTLLYDNRNPIVDANNGLTQIEQNIATLNASAEIRFNKDLYWKTTVASAGNWMLRDNYNSEVYGYTSTGVETLTKNLNREGFEIARAHEESIRNNLFSTLNFDKTLGNNHYIGAIAGVQLENYTFKNSYARRIEPPKIGLNQVDAGTTGYVAEGNMNALSMLSYFGRFNYSFANKYLFEANLRADGSSRFKEGNRWGIFPGFSAGWRVIDESFMQSLDYISNFKFRASWGQLGNQNIAGYWPYLYVIEQNNELSYSYGGVFFPGAAVTSLVDENITWETTTTLDFGVDLGFVNNKINIEADYFKRTTTDILVQLPIPMIMGGLTPPYENVGEMENTGFEFIVNYDNHAYDRNQLAYNVGVNLTYVTNEVTKFRGGDSPDQLYLIREGYSYRTLYGYKAVGIYQSDAEAAEHMHSNGYVPVAGNLKYEDVNNDGRLGFEDKQGIGNTIPKLTYGLNANLSYQGFDLNILFQGIAGVNAYVKNNYTDLQYENLIISKGWLDAWSPTNTDSETPMARFDNTWDNYDSSYWARSIAFLKLKNLQLGYEFPEQLTSRVGLQRIYLYANAQNVFTIVDKDYEGFDPEKNTFDDGDRFYAPPRIISFGINLNF